MQPRSRLQLCLILALTPLAPIAARLVYLQIFNHEDLSQRARTSTARQWVEIIPRGRILDRDGHVLAQSLPAWSSFLDIKVFREDPREPGPRLERLGATLGLQPEEISRLLKTKRRTVWLKRKMTVTEVTRLRGLKMRSIGIVVDERRYYPNESLMRPILGSVDSSGRGNAGLELYFDKDLSGRAVRWELTRDGTGRAILHSPGRREAPPPDLRLTLDRTLQYFAEEALAVTVRAHQAASGSILVQDPRTGEILVMASYPSDPFHNAAVQDVYEPGSTFKIIMAAAALESDALKKGERIDCELGKWQMTSKIRIKDHEPLGQLTLSEIIRFSSNIGSAKLGLRLGAETLHRYARLFGFGYKTGIPLPAESAGLMKPASKMTRIRLANGAFGQGLAVTPLQLIGAFSAVANGGTLFEPRLVKRLGDETSRKPVPVRRAIRPETAREIQKMLEAVVESGTGKSAQVPGYRIAGKTGTAQKIDPETKQYSVTDYISSFAGYVPAGDPLYTVLVVIDSSKKGHYGSVVAAPLFKKLVRRILALKGVPPQRALPLRLRAERMPRARPLHRTPLPRPSLLKGASYPAGSPEEA